MFTMWFGYNRLSFVIFYTVISCSTKSHITPTQMIQLRIIILTRGHIDRFHAPRSPFNHNTVEFRPQLTFDTTIFRRIFKRFLRYQSEALWDFWFEKYLRKIFKVCICLFFYFKYLPKIDEFFMISKDTAVIEDRNAIGEIYSVDLSFKSFLVSCSLVVYS